MLDGIRKVMRAKAGRATDRVVERIARRLEPTIKPGTFPKAGMA